MWGRRPMGRQRDRWENEVRERVMKKGEAWENVVDEKRLEDRIWWR